jgi:hypothetical protein
MLPRSVASNPKSRHHQNPAQGTVRACRKGAAQGSLAASRGVKDCTWRSIARHLGRETRSVSDLEVWPEALAAKMKSRR